jgi:photosystem II stability/assembly factor-like uncharacterized protein
MSTVSPEHCVLGLSAETLSAWRDGFLEPEEARRVGAHAPACAACQQIGEQFEWVRQTLLGQTPPDLRAGVWQGLRVRMHSIRQRTQRWSGGGPNWRGAAALVAAILVVTLLAALLAQHAGTVGHPVAQTPTPADTPSPTATPTPTLPPIAPNTGPVLVVPNEAEVGGDHVFVTADAGAHWRDVTPAPVLAASSTIGMGLVGTGAFFLDATTGWVAFPSGYPTSGDISGCTTVTVMRTADGGQTWATVSVAVPQELSCRIDAVQFIDGSHGWVSLDQRTGNSSEDTLIGTSDGGATWRLLFSTGIGGSGTLHFLNASDGWRGAGDLDVPPSLLEVTHDGGSTWQDVPPGTFGNGSAISLPGFFTTQDGVLASMTCVTDAYGDCAAATLNFYGTHDGGATWSLLAQFPQPAPSSCNDNGFPPLYLALYAQHVWVACEGELYATTNGGQTWSARPTTGFIPTRDLQDLQFVSDSVGWGYAHSTFILRTTDGGSTWTQVPLPGIS